MNTLLIFLNNFLTSGHHFGIGDNLQKFRFVFLNSILAISMFFTLLHFSLSSLGLVRYHYFVSVGFLFYTILAAVVLYLLRQDKDYYEWIISYLMFNTLLLCFLNLFMHTEDEFRLITFFLVSLSGFMFLGRSYGLKLSLFLFFSIFLFNSWFDLKLSSLALSSFFTFFFIFSVSLYIFFQKMEQDASDLVSLENSLKEQEKMLSHQSMILKRSELGS